MSRLKVAFLIIGFGISYSASAIDYATRVNQNSFTTTAGQAFAQTVGQFAGTDFRQIVLQANQAFQQVRQQLNGTKSSNFATRASQGKLAASSGQTFTQTVGQKAAAIYQQVQQQADQVSQQLAATTPLKFASQTSQSNFVTGLGQTIAQTIGQVVGGANLQVAQQVNQKSSQAGPQSFATQVNPAGVGPGFGQSFIQTISQTVGDVINTVINGFMSN